MTIVHILTQWFLIIVLLLISVWFNECKILILPTICHMNLCREHLNLGYVVKVRNHALNLANNEYKTIQQSLRTKMELWWN